MIVEYNDALYTLFATAVTLVDQPRHNDTDATVTPTTLQVCQDLALCPVQSSETGSSFNTSQWDQYDLLVATDEALAARLLAMNNDQSDAYMDKIRTLADFVPFATKNKDTDDLILVQRLEPDLWDRVAPYTHLWDDMDRVFRYATVGCSSSPLLVWQDENNVAATNCQSWPLAQAGLIAATACLVDFLLATIDRDMHEALDNLVETHCRYYYTRLAHNDTRTPANNEADIDALDDQIRRSNAMLTGYFSPHTRRAKIQDCWTKWISTEESML